MPNCSCDFQVGKQLSYMFARVGPSFRDGHLETRRDKAYLYRDIGAPNFERISPMFDYFAVHFLYEQIYFWTSPERLANN